jgi:hypothetical protein
MATTLKLSGLTHEQKSHLAWRLDHNTACGFGTACSIARGEHGDMDIVEIFQRFGNRTPHSAKILARKVSLFTL